MSSYSQFPRTLVRTGVAQGVAGVVVGATAVVLIKRWLDARARRKAAAPEAPVVETVPVAEAAAAPARPRKRAARPRKRV